MIVTSTLVALPLLAVALVARRFRSDFEETAWRLMAVAMLLAPAGALLPKIELGFRVPLLTAATSIVAGQRPELATDGTPSILLIVYGVVTLLLLTRIVIAVAAARRLRSGAQPFAGAYLSTALRVPVTAGLTEPAILLPHDALQWSGEKLAAVLAHERAHVARRDPLWRFIGRAAAAVCWFHPLAWLAAASIERLAEEAADREAVAAIGNRHEYANVVLDMLRTMTGTSRRVFASSMLDGHAVGARIDAILRAAETRRSPRAARLLLVFLVFSAIFTTAMTKPEPPRRAARVVMQQDAMTQQESNDPQMHRTRDELRHKFRTSVRTTMRALFGGFVP